MHGGGGAGDAGSAGGAGGAGGARWIKSVTRFHLFNTFEMSFFFCISSVESQKGVINIQRCSVENHIICTAVAPFRFSKEHL